MAPANYDEALELYKSSLEALGEFCGKEVSQVAQEMDKNSLRYENGRVIFQRKQLKYTKNLEIRG